jgi:hypothetical protein
MYFIYKYTPFKFPGTKKDRSEAAFLILYVISILVVQDSVVHTKT